MWLFRERLSFSAAVIGFPLLAIGLGLVIASSIAPSSPLSKVRGFGLIAALAYSAYLTHKEIIHCSCARSGQGLLLSSPVGMATAFGSLTFVGSAFWLRLSLYMADRKRPFLNQRWDRWRGRLKLLGARFWLLTRGAPHFRRRLGPKELDDGRYKRCLDDGKKRR